MVISQQGTIISEARNNWEAGGRALRLCSDCGTGVATHPGYMVKAMLGSVGIPAWGLGMGQGRDRWIPEHSTSGGTYLKSKMGVRRTGEWGPASRTALLPRLGPQRHIPQPLYSHLTSHPLEWSLSPISQDPSCSGAGYTSQKNKDPPIEWQAKLTARTQAPNLGTVDHHSSRSSEIQATKTRRPKRKQNFNHPDPDA